MQAPPSPALADCDVGIGDGSGGDEGLVLHLGRGSGSGTHAALDRGRAQGTAPNCCSGTWGLQSGQATGHHAGGGPEEVQGRRMISCCTDAT